VRGGLSQGVPPSRWRPMWRRSPVRHRRERAEWEVSPIRGSRAPHHRKPLEPRGIAGKLPGGWAANGGPNDGVHVSAAVEVMDEL
jgi:hypothetical protein